MKIGLDAGHGLKTAGKQSPNGIKEWDINDKVRDEIAVYLNDYVVDIIHTDNDEGDVDESLMSRRNMYINANVDVFVSTHHNALDGKWGEHTGIEVYVDKNATKEDLELAKLVHDKLVAYTGLKGRGVKRANFTIINQNKITAILVEGGFMDSSIDYPIITSEIGQKAYARAVAESLIEFLGLKKKVIISNDKEVTPYTVKIKSDDGFLNVRQEPNSNSTIKTTVKNGEVYTIVAENGNWGKLKSGVGYIHLGFTEKPNKVNQPAYSYYPACDKKHTSIVAALKSIKVDSSFDFRKKIAQKNNVKDYTGKAQENTQLLTKLKAGRLRKV